MALNQYACYQITADADENIIPKLFEAAYNSAPILKLTNVKFIGFEAEAGTTIKLNGLANKVPSNGKFYTPYVNEYACLKIDSLSFDEGCSDLDVWVIF